MRFVIPNDNDSSRLLRGYLLTAGLSVGDKPLLLGPSFRVELEETITGGVLFDSVDSPFERAIFAEVRLVANVTTATQGGRVFTDNAIRIEVPEDKRAQVVLAIYTAILRRLRVVPEKKSWRRLLGLLSILLCTSAAMAQGVTPGAGGTQKADVTKMGGTTVPAGVVDTGNTAIKVNCVIGCGASSGLTDAELRATPVPVSGTFWQATQPVSGTFWQATQPVSGTVTSNIGTSGSLALDASVTGLQVTQGSTTSGQSGTLVQGAVTTGAPTYTTAQTSPLSLTTTGRLRTDGSGVTQPISAASLPLPTGASTSANQPALGTAGAASADVITVQGIASMTKLLVTPDSVALPANQSVNVAQVAGTATSVNSGTKDAGTLRVVLATDQPQLSNKLLVTPDSVALPSNQSVNVSQINAVTPLMGNGATGTGSQRVTIASDNTAFPIKLDQTTSSNDVDVLTLPNVTIATFPDNEPINVAQMNGVAITMNNGVVGTGVQRVTLASDSTGNIATIGTSVTPGTSAAHLGKAEDAAHASGDTGVATLAVRKETSAQITSADGDYSPFVVDGYGALFVRKDHPNRIRCTITSTATTSTLVTGCSAPGAGLSIHVTDINWSSSIISSTANFMRLQSGTGGTCGTATTVLYDGYTPTAFGNQTFNLGTPIKLTANHELCFVHASAGTRLVNVSGYIAP